MRRITCLGWIVVLLVAVAVPAVVQGASSDDDWVVTTPSRDEADLIEPSPSYGYMYEDGSLAISLDTAAVFAPELAMMLVHPDYESTAADTFEAEIMSDDTWNVADPETGEMMEVQVQRAAYNFDDGSETSALILGEGLETLTVVEASKVALIRWPYRRVYRLRVHHTCGEPISPPWPWWPEGVCWSGYKYTSRDADHFLRCTFMPWSFCLDRFRATWTLTHYTCRDCTGPILWQSSYAGWVCAAY